MDCEIHDRRFLPALSSCKGVRHIAGANPYRQPRTHVFFVSGSSFERGGYRGVINAEFRRRKGAGAG